MKYAIISDIHGNIHAFDAVLADAKEQKADKLLLLGDYASNFPYGNEVVEVIRKLKSTTVVKGNGEDYFTGLKSTEDLIYEQYKPIYWSYRSLSPENLEYLLNLPESETITDNDVKIHLTHSMGIFYRSPEIKLFHSHHYHAMMLQEPFPPDEYLVRAQKALLECPDAVAEICALPEGVYLFGHNHMQFHMEYKDRLFINPGSCGEPLDWDTKASYTVLERASDKWIVDERKISYDSDQAIFGLKDSGYSDYAPEWSKVVQLELKTGRDYFCPFVNYFMNEARKAGWSEGKISNDIWLKAAKNWDPDAVYT